MGTTLINRGDVWLINFDPTIGHEIKKTRPAVIVQNNIGNNSSPMTIAVPISSRNVDKIYPFEVFLQESKFGIEVESKILCDQIKAIDKRRLVKKLGVLDYYTSQKVDQALRYSLDI